MKKSLLAGVKYTELATNKVAEMDQAAGPGGSFRSAGGVAEGGSPPLRPENMVHQTISTSRAPAARASSKISVMGEGLRWSGVALIVGTLAACAGPPRQAPAPVRPVAAPAPARPFVPAPAAASAPLPATAAPAIGLPSATALAADTAPLVEAPWRGKSRWTPVRWAELPGFAEDNLFEAWNAWIKNCERPGPALAALCTEVRQLSIADGDAQRQWMVARLQPYRVEAEDGRAEGLLTSYYEPLLSASRVRTAEYAVPLYRPPAGLGSRKPWYTRQEIDTQAQAQAALQGREIAWLASPVDALMLQIQGSGRVLVTEPDGRRQLVRLAFAATNDQPYQSVGRWLLDRRAVRDASWPAIREWAAQNPQRLDEMLWSNPRVVFFREEPLGDFEAWFGPRGAQGVALTPGRSIAVDPGSIPFGTPVWLASPGPAAALQKLVFAQDTGSAIVGAVRADYFAGWGDEAGALAGRVKQPLRLWVLWPR